MNNVKAEVSDEKGINENILFIGNQPFWVYKKIIQILYYFEEDSMTEPNKEMGKLQMQNENEKAEDNEHKGMIANIFALSSLPIQLCKKTIQLLNPFDNEKAEVSEEKGIVANMLVFRHWHSHVYKKIFRTQDSFDNEKAEVSEEKGIVAKILAFRHWHSCLYRKIFQTQNYIDALRAWMDGLLLWIPRGDVQEKIQELQRQIDQLQKELEWRKARNNTDDIILDTNTAHPNLYIAEDRKSFSYETKPQQVPPNSEKFDSAVCVLGTEGFTHGKHYWEVDVGNISDWDLGVARKSIKRKGKISLSPKEGFWVLSVSGRDYWAKTDPWCRVTVQKKPKKIGVYLSYNGKQVTFFNVTDMSVLFTFNDCSFSEEVCPFFKNSHKETTMRIASIKEEELI
nr:E3 ubiquitin-protein ligase TRIM68-like isoform X2 [Pelodiscus sinensis]|eukprot:XP_014428894.1 E3 ubiquitin-protein ligase TRIM68-like isoform X2 [Pelodiscus sinensis]